LHWLTGLYFMNSRCPEDFIMKIKR